MQLDDFIDALWADYRYIAPAAGRLYDSVEAEGETILNDHVAFRTYDHSPISLDELEPHLLALGFEYFEDYAFEAKKLRAKGYLHPTNKRLPRTFLSELETRKFSPVLQEKIAAICASIPADAVTGPEVFYSGRLWAPVSFADYEALRAESEYAAWVAAIGLRANHFTIGVNGLQKYTTLESLLDFVESKGYDLNTSGGRIKGTPEVYLEQASTLADELEIEFADGPKKVPTCYYEFARRYEQPNGELYQGFIAASADKIFESTNARK